MGHLVLVANTFETVVTGPAKFNRILQTHFIGQTKHRITIVTSDISVDRIDSFEGVNVQIHFVKRKTNFLTDRYFGIFRIFLYAKAIYSLYRKDEVDVVVFSNLYTGLLSKLFSKDVLHIGMINDDNNVFPRSIKRRFYRVLEKHAVRIFDKIIVNSMYLKRTVSKEYEVPLSTIEVLYKAVSKPDKLKTSWSLKNKDEITVLFVKNDFVRGNLFLLISALRRLKSFRFRLIVIGPEISDIVRYVHELDFGNLVVEPLGPKPQDVVFKIMTDSDLFCVPASAEALGVANMEAMIHKLPVVSSDAGGIPEVLGFGEYGFMSRADDLDSLTEALELCCSQEEERIDRMNKAYALIRERFSIENSICKFMQIVEMD